MQLGKDTYIEKPISHNVFEGWQMVQAARKYQRAVQVGTQSRSVAHYLEAVELLTVSRGSELARLVPLAKDLLTVRQIETSPPSALLQKGV